MSSCNFGVNPEDLTDAVIHFVIMGISVYYTLLESSQVATEAFFCFTSS